MILSFSMCTGLIGKSHANAAYVNMILHLFLFKSSYQYSATLAESDVGFGQGDSHWAHIRSFRQTALFVLSNDGEGCHHRAVAYRHKCVSAGTHVCVHNAIKGVVVRITSDVTNAHSCTQGRKICTILRLIFTVYWCQFDMHVLILLVSFIQANPNTNTMAGQHEDGGCNWKSVYCTCVHAAQLTFIDLTFLSRTTFPCFTSHSIEGWTYTALCAVIFGKPAVSNLKNTCYYNKCKKTHILINIQNEIYTDTTFLHQYRSNNSANNSE